MYIHVCMYTWRRLIQVVLLSLTKRHGDRQSIDAEAVKLEDGRTMLGSRFRCGKAAEQGKRGESDTRGSGQVCAEY